MGKFVQMVKPVNFEMDYFLHEIFKKFGLRKEICEKNVDSTSEERMTHTENLRSRSEMEPTPTETM